MIKSLRELAGVPYFFQMLAARSISNLGNGVSPVALAFGVLSIEGADAVSLSQVMAARTFPILILLIVGGAVADRFGRARVMGWSDMSLSVLIFIAAISFILDSPSVLLLVLVGVLSGILNGIWYPAFAGLTPIVVPADKLQSANSVIGFGSNFSFMIGTALGGLIVGFFGVGWALAFDALTFFVAGALILPLSKLKQAGLVAKGEKTNVLKDIKEGWGEFSSRGWLVAVVVGFAFVNLAFEANWAVLGALQSRDSFDGAVSWAQILGALSFGMILGVIIANRSRPKYPLRAAMAMTLFIPIFLFAIAIPLPLPWVMLAAVGAGMGLDYFYVLWITTVQTKVPEESLSRVNSYDAFGSFLFGPIGIAVAGPLALIFGLQATMLTSATITLIAILLLLLMPSVRKLEAEQLEPKSEEQSAKPVA
jgi:MFS family permease